MEGVAFFVLLVGVPIQLVGVVAYGLTRRHPVVGGVVGAAAVPVAAAALVFAPVGLRLDPAPCAGMTADEARAVATAIAAVLVAAAGLGGWTAWRAVTGRALAVPLIAETAAVSDGIALLLLLAAGTSC